MGRSEGRSGEARREVLRRAHVLRELGNPPAHALRIPLKRVDASVLRPYFVRDRARAKVAGGHLILDLCSEDEGADYYDGSQGVLGALVPLRSELMRGDLRVAYLAWLMAVQKGEVSGRDVEPTVPAGLAELTAAQTATVEFLRIDEDLIAAATMASPANGVDTDTMRAWAMALKPRTKDSWLAHAIENPELALGAEMRRTFRSENERLPQAGRRVAELRAAAEQIREKREQIGRLAAEKAKKVAESAKKKRSTRSRRGSMQHGASSRR